MSAVPITERANVITEGIDVATAEGMLRLLRQSDEQMFAGYSTHATMGDTTDQLATLSDLIRAHVLSKEPATVVMGGSGTSGRFAFNTARSFNAVLLQRGMAPVLQYLCAGGDPALFQSQEAPEDNWQLGIEQLEAITSKHTRVLYIGITCGLSAPVVAAQLWHCLAHPDRFTTVLLGFNPPTLARDIVIEGWDKSVKAVVDAMLEVQAATPAGQMPRALVMTPVVGPEPITGSSRMKGASATKILLECAFTRALHASVPAATLPDLMQEYAAAIRSTYMAGPQLAALVTAAGHALRANGHIYYLGHDSFGIAALIDASECQPTFNAVPDDVRAFLQHGFTALRNIDGDLEPRGRRYLLSWDAFEAEFLPAVTAHDLVIAITALQATVDPQLARMCSVAKQQGAAIALLSVSDKQPADVRALLARVLQCDHHMCIVAGR